MKMKLFTFCLVVLFIGCSSLPEDQTQVEQTQGRTIALQLLDQGNAQFDRALYETALENYRLALYTYAGIDHSKGMISALLASARCHAAMGDQIQSEITLNYALQLSREEGEAFQERKVLNQFCDLSIKSENLEEALEYANMETSFSIHSAHEVNSERLRLLGTIYKKQQDYIEALQALEAALAMDQQVKNNAGIASDHYLIASIYSLQGEYSLARNHLVQALDMDRFMEYVPGIASDLTAMGKVYTKEGLTEEAVYYLTKAYLAWKGLGREAEMQEISRLIEELKGESFLSP